MGLAPAISLANDSHSSEETTTENEVLPLDKYTSMWESKSDDEEDEEGGMLYSLFSPLINVLIPGFSQFQKGDYWEGAGYLSGMVASELGSYFVKGTQFGELSTPLSWSAWFFRGLSAYEAFSGQVDEGIIDLEFMNEFDTVEEVSKAPLNFEALSNNNIILFSMFMQVLTNSTAFQTEIGASKINFMNIFSPKFVNILLSSTLKTYLFSVGHVSLFNGVLQPEINAYYDNSLLHSIFLTTAISSAFKIGTGVYPGAMDGAAGLLKPIMMSFLSATNTYQNRYSIQEAVLYNFWMGILAEFIPEFAVLLVE